MKPFRPFIDEAEYEYVTESALQLLRYARHAQRFGDNPFTRFAFVKQAFRAALKKQDFDFFVRVGDVIRKRQIDESIYEARGFSKLQEFLLIHWVDEVDGLPPLYNLQKGVNPSPT